MTTMIKKYGFSALRVALLGICAAAIAAPMHAQDAPPPPPPGGGYGHGGGGENPARMLKHLTRELNLTPDQVSQVQAIQSDEATKMQALQADSSDTGKGRHQQMKAIHEDETGRIRAVLTGDQVSKYDAMLEQMKERRQEHRQGGQNQPPPPPPSSL